MSARQHLPKKEQLELVKRAQLGDLEARHKLILTSEGLVYHYIKKVRKYVKSGVVAQDDLFSEGIIGLARAIDKFDADKKTSFPTYAIHWIRAHIWDYIQMNYGTIRATYSDMHSCLFFKNGMVREMLDTEDPEERQKIRYDIIRLTGVTESQMDKYLDWFVNAGSRISLDKTFTSEWGSASVKEFIKDVALSRPDNIVERRELHERVRQAIKKAGLSDRERDIINSRFFMDEPMILKELGERYGITSERTRQLQNRALGKIKNHIPQEICYE